MKASHFAEVYDAHDRRWEERRPEMRRLRNAYLMRYWDKRETDQLLIETSRGYELIESYVASLFVKDPAVVVQPDIRGAGNPEVAQEVANVWLHTVRAVLENALRLALIYPFGAVKLGTREHPDPLQRVTVAAVAPWDIIVDTTAETWEAQRFVAHRYYLPVEVAKERYGAKKYTERRFMRYITEDVEGRGDGAGYDRVMGADGGLPPSEEHFILVVEVYDLAAGEFKVWSPDWKEDGWLYDGVPLEAGEDGELQKFKGIPFKTASGAVKVPLVPLYMSTEPDEPLAGYSALRRVYDQVAETNIIRTFQANGVRKAARQWMVEKGVLDPESMAKIAQGRDGEFIEVELSVGQTLAGSIAPIPHVPVPVELERYLQEVDADFGRGSVLAPFTRGEATRASATEVQALAAYSASEIGRMARARDACITATAHTYLVMLAVLMGDTSDLIRLGGKLYELQAADLLGDFQVFAHDLGTTPMSTAVKKQELLTLLPLLEKLGVAPPALLNMVVRAFDLPADMMTPEAPAAPAVEGVADMARGPAIAAPPEPGVVAGANPGPVRMDAVLPPGGVV